MLNELRFQENIERKFRKNAVAYIGYLATVFGANYSGKELLWHFSVLQNTYGYIYIKYCNRLQSLF
jgi:hypothetical protein